jgi:DNA-binding MarR family transcriptional regulator
MTDIAHMINVTTAAMTGIIDRLVKSGCVVRINDPKDRRITKVRLTPKGNQVVENMIEQRKKLTIKLFEMISQSEREEYLRILGHIRDHLK